MKIIGKNNQVIELLSNNESLLSSKLMKIEIYYSNNQLFIDLTIELLYSKKFKKIILRFEGVSEYSFFYTSDRFFYNIERYVLLKDKDLFYLSLDPFDEHTTIRNIEDNDFILSQNVALLVQI
jgi:hypothetical protein